MPKQATTSKKKPVAPIKPVAPAPVPEPVATDTSGLSVKYPTLTIEEFSSTSDEGPLDVQWAKDALWWETEREYQKRMVEAEPGTKPEAWIYGDVFHCRNAAGEKVRTHYNAQNRPFDDEWCKALVETILEGQWAGPHTIPDGTVNGETIRISKYGRVVSGQHTMTALILAAEKLAALRAAGRDHADNPQYPAWSKRGAPFIETIVIKGMSEDPRVLMTVDYNKPRTAADMFYTSEAFRESTSTERKELCRVLSGAVDMLWERTKTLGYRTHPEVAAFLERHKSLMKCVEYVFRVNGSGADGRKLSKLKLNLGTCAAVSYLMGCSGADGDVYRNPDKDGLIPPSEKGLDWTHWDKQEEFWDGLANDREFTPVRQAFYDLMSSSPTHPTNQGLGGRGPERLAVLALAWDRYRSHEGSGAAFTVADLEPSGCLRLHYSDVGPPNKNGETKKLPPGEIRLIEVADFYGIDCPPTTSEASDPPLGMREEIEQAKEDARARRAK